MKDKEIIKLLQTIEPDPHYRELSRRVVLAHAPSWRAGGVRGLVRYMARSFPGMALATMGIALLIGGFSVIRSFAPIGTPSLDPIGLRVEAEAIDIQVRLANLKYIETENKTKSESTVRVVGEPAELMLGDVGLSPTSTPAIDEVLELLMQ